MRVVVAIVLAMGLLSSCDSLTRRTLGEDIPLHKPKPVVAMRLKVGDTMAFTSRITLAHDPREYWDLGGGISTLHPDLYEIFLYRNGSLWCGPFELGRFPFFEGQPICMLDEPVPPGPDVYELVVETEGYGTLRAVQTMPTCVPFDTVIVHSMEADLVRGLFKGVIEVHFTDPPGEANFYELVAKDSCGSPITRYTLTLTSLDEKAIRGATKGLVLSDAMFDGKQESLLLGFEGTTGGVAFGGSFEDCAVWLEFISITEDRYRFLKTLTRANEAFNNAFAEPLHIYYNIENGLGLFSAECQFTYRLY